MTLRTRAIARNRKGTSRLPPNLLHFRAPLHDTTLLQSLSNICGLKLPIRPLYTHIRSLPLSPIAAVLLADTDRPDRGTRQQRSLPFTTTGRLISLGYFPVWIHESHLQMISTANVLTSHTTTPKDSRNTKETRKNTLCRENPGVGLSIPFESVKLGLMWC